MIIRTVTYGIGGYDPTKPNDNIVEITEIEVPDTTDTVAPVVEPEE